MNIFTNMVADLYMNYSFLSTNFLKDIIIHTVFTCVSYRADKFTKHDNFEAQIVNNTFIPEIRIFWRQNVQTLYSNKCS